MHPTTSSPWVFAIEEDKVKEKSVTVVFPKGLSVLLIKSAGQISALSNKCEHMACPLSGGVLKDQTIQCPCHDWRFDIRTGEFLNAREIKVPVYPWRLEDRKIFIHLEEGGRS